MEQGDAAGSKGQAVAEDWREISLLSRGLCVPSESIADMKTSDLNGGCGRQTVTARRRRENGGRKGEGR